MVALCTRASLCCAREHIAAGRRAVAGFDFVPDPTIWGPGPNLCTELQAGDELQLLNSKHSQGDPGWWKVRNMSKKTADGAQQEGYVPKSAVREERDGEGEAPPCGDCDAIIAQVRGPCPRAPRHFGTHVRGLDCVWIAPDVHARARFFVSSGSSARAWAWAFCRCFVSLSRVSPGTHSIPGMRAPCRPPPPSTRSMRARTAKGAG